MGLRNPLNDLRKGFASCFPNNDFDVVMAVRGSRSLDLAAVPRSRGQFIAISDEHCVVGVSDMPFRVLAEITWQGPTHGVRLTREFLYFRLDIDGFEAPVYVRPGLLPGSGGQRLKRRLLNDYK